MKGLKKRRLERAGWVVGDSAQFLQLSEEENRFIELKLALATGVRRPLCVARSDHAVAPHQRGDRDRHCQVHQTCRSRAGCLGRSARRDVSE